MKMYEVLDNVSMWLDEPRNRCVEDQLYLIGHCSKKYRKEALKNIITARIYQGLNVDPSTLSPVFIGRCVGVMWRWYYTD